MIKQNNEEKESVDDCMVESYEAIIKQPYTNTIKTISLKNKSVWAINEIVKRLS